MALPAIIDISGSMPTDHGDFNVWGGKLNNTLTLIANKENEIIGYLNTDVAGFQAKTEKNQPNGYVGLGADGKIAIVNIPDSLIGAVVYMGTWNASANNPTLAITPSAKGIYYKVSAIGTQFGIDFAVGDWIISNGATWEKVDNTDLVSSVNGQVGAVVLTKTDVGLGLADNTSDTTKIDVNTYTSLNTTSKTVSGAINEHELDIVDLNRKAKVYTFDSVTLAQSASWLVEGDIVEILGYNTKGDGSGCKFKVSNTNDGTDIPRGTLWLNYINEEVNELKSIFTIQEYLEKYSKLKLENKTYTENINDFNGVLKGTGMTKTILNGNLTLKPSETQKTPSTIEDLQINGTVDISNKHYLSFKNLIVNGVNDGYKAKDSWLNVHENCHFIGTNGHGVNLVGANHQNVFKRISATGSNGKFGFYIGSAGTALDGNMSLLLDSCDVEFCNCGGVQNDSGSVLNILNGYFEQIKGATLHAKSGDIHAIGGSYLTSKAGETTSVLANLEGGDITIEKSLVSEHESGRILTSGIIAGTGKLKIKDCNFAVPWASGINITGDVLKKEYGGYNFLSNNLYSANFIHLSGGGNNGTKTLNSDGSVNFKVTASGFQEIDFSIQNNKQLSKDVNIFFVYKSNKDLNVRFHGGNFGGAPTSGGFLLPSTSGIVKTFGYKNPVGGLVDGYTALTLFNTLAVNDEITIYDISVFTNESVNLEKNLFFPK